MNEKIRELLTQAQVSANAAVPGDWSDRTIFAERLHTTFEQFAELIVRECAGLVDHVIMEDGTRRSDFICKHFGVER